MKLWISGIAIVMLCASPLLAQNVLRVPEDYSTIREAVLAAFEGDTIRVGPGTYCGANITKRLTILGEGQPTISPTACSSTYTLGFFLTNPNASGTTIRNLNLSGVSIGILAFGVNDVTVEHNTMQLKGASTSGIMSVFATIGGQNVAGSSWTVSHNTISIDITDSTNGAGIVNGAGSDWTVSHNKLTGTGLRMGIWFARLLDFKPAGRSMNNTAAFNHVEGADNAVGIALNGQEDAVVRNNEIFIPSSPDPDGVCGAWGIEITDSGLYKKDGQQYALTSNNSVIKNNDTRGTAVGVIVFLDSLGGTGNSIGNVLRGNFGTLAINEPKTGCGAGTIDEIIKNRAIWTLINCDETGVCNDIP